MPFIVRKAEGGIYIPAPAELQQAVCCDIVDKGLMDGQYGPKAKVQIRWFSEFEMPPEKVGEDGIANYMITGLYTAILHERSTLQKLLVAWRGKAFTQEELDGFDLETVIGANCLLNVVHKQKEERVYANIESITPLKRGMEKMDVPKGYVRAKDRDDWKEPPRPVDAPDAHEQWSGENNHEDPDDPDWMPF